MKKYLLILSFFFLSGILSQTLANEANILQLIQAQYQSILSFSGHFTQTSFRANSKTTPRKARGEVFYKRPGKMRWMYVAPEDQLLVTNGDTLWLYDTLLENVTIQKLNKLTDGTALSFLLGLGDLNNDTLINIVDVVILVNLILSDGAYNIIADINEDGIVNIIDIVIIVNWILSP